MFPLGANSLLLEKTPLENDIDVQEGKQEVMKFVSYVQEAGNATKCIRSPRSRSEWTCWNHLGSLLSGLITKDGLLMEVVFKTGLTVYASH